MMGIILEIEQVLRTALQRVPLKKWPWLAGWEHLSPHVSLRPELVQDIPVECLPEPEDRSDDEDSEVAEDSGDDEAEMRRAAALPDPDGAEVLRAWDELQRGKVAARMTVGVWTLEYVLRKVSACAAGDCYAKRAGRPRVRSRVALVAMLGAELAVCEVGDRGVRASAAAEPGEAQSGAGEELEADASDRALGVLELDHDEAAAALQEVAAEDEIGGGDGPVTVGDEAAGADSPAADDGSGDVDSPRVVRDGCVGSDGSAAISSPEMILLDAKEAGEVQRQEGGDEESESESDEGEDAGPPAVKSGKVRRPPGASLDLWRLTHGGFPDGDTAMKPPLEAKRARR